jgi:hypothetical protein
MTQHNDAEEQTASSPLEVASRYVVVFGSLAWNHQWMIGPLIQQWWSEQPKGSLSLIVESGTPVGDWTVEGIQGISIIRARLDQNYRGPRDRERWGRIMSSGITDAIALLDNGPVTDGGRDRKTMTEKMAALKGAGIPVFSVISTMKE